MSSVDTRLDVGLLGVMPLHAAGSGVREKVTGVQRTEFSLVSRALLLLCMSVMTACPE